VTTFNAANSALIRQLNTLDFGDMAPSEPMIAVFTPACTDLKTAVTEWRSINTKDVVALNALLAKSNLKPIPAVSPLPAVPVCTLGTIGTTAPGRSGGAR
jgi:hypothetical protein